MGLIRGGLFVIASVLLLIVFIAGSTFITLDSSLNYGIVKPEITSVVNTAILGQVNLASEVDSMIPLMNLSCQNRSEFVYDSKELGQVLTLPCSVIAQGADAVINYSVGSVVDNIYYKNYQCNFWSCFKESQYPFFLISKTAKDYWHAKFYLSLLVALGLIALMFLLIEKKTNLPLVVGGLLILASLPFMKLDSLLGFFANKEFLSIITIFFTQAHHIFLISLVLGIIVLAAGIVLKFFKAGFWINNFLSKFHREDNSTKSK